VTAGVATRSARRIHWFDLSRWSDRTALIAIVAAAVLALLVWAPLSKLPGDPSAVAGDPRLARCGGTVADIDYAFTIPHAADYQRYLPAMPKTSELELPNPALIVIYKATFTFDGSTPDPEAAPTARLVCIYVGDAGAGELNSYSGISIAGLRATPDGPVLVPAENN